jgi:signal transduction histidine kinase/CheY-like chemotaxis protein
MSHALRLMPSVWLLLLLFLAFPASAQTFCRISLATPVQIFEDSSGTLGVTEVEALPDARFVDWSSGGFPVSFSRSAFWLKLSLQASSGSPCRAWLSIGEPRLEQVQVYIPTSEGWREMRAGSDFPLEQWAMPNRQPLFPLAFEEGESGTLLVRVASRSLLTIAPRLQVGLEQLQLGERISLINGVVLGIMLLVVPFGLIVGAQIRSMLLLTNALSSLAYMLLTCVANGYLFYWPELLPWSRELVSLLAGCTVLLFSFYLAVLFEVRYLPPFWRRLMRFYFWSMAGLLLVGAVFDFVGTRQLFSVLRWFFYLLVPALCLAAWWHGRRLSWLAWALSGVLLIQGVALLLLDGQTSVWQYGEDQLDLVSGLIGAVLLFFTLIAEFTRSRQQAQLARAQLKVQQEAEQQRLESMVELRTAQLHESLKVRSDLLARISHDLRSPLAGIIDYSRLLRNDGVQDYPQRIERSARLQLELIDELLSFAQDELQQEELVLAPGYLHGFLREIEDEARYLAQRQGNHLLCDFAADLPPLVQADFRQLRRVLVNLLGNASKFTREGSIVLRVERLDSDVADFALRFSLADSGIGVPTELRTDLLKPFARGSNTAGIEGFGLGLSIVSDLLRQMGSELQFADNRPHGSIFSFALHLHSACEETVDKVFQESHSLESDGAGRRILLVDDVELTRVFLGDLLSGYGYDVTLADGGEEALASIAWADIDLLITDQFMPGMDGWALLREVRRYRPTLPVLLYSALPARPGAGNEGLHFDAVLLKPANADELLACIERLSS